MCSALSLQCRSNRITVMENLDFNSISTKEFVSFMKRFEIERSLIITDDFSNNLQLSCRNVPHIKLLKYDALNIHDILKYKNIIITQGAVQSVEGVLNK